ncbi:hypothetical protein D3C78_1601180 [compost metagenome]
MHEDRRAPVAASRGDVPVKHQADVVEAVLAHHFFMAQGEGRLDQPVIIGVAWLVAP